MYSSGFHMTSPEARVGNHDPILHRDWQNQNYRGFEK
jgi:hypothetical protein